MLIVAGLKRCAGVAASRTEARRCYTWTVGCGPANRMKVGKVDAQSTRRRADVEEQLQVSIRLHLRVSAVSPTRFRGGGLDEEIRSGSSDCAPPLTAQAVPHKQAH